MFENYPEIEYYHPVLNAAIWFALAVISWTIAFLMVRGVILLGDVIQWYF